MDTLNQKSVGSIHFSDATASAGMHSSHTLPLKLQTIVCQADAGFSKWTKVATPDLGRDAQSRIKDYKELDESGRGLERTRGSSWKKSVDSVSRSGFAF